MKRVRLDVIIPIVFLLFAAFVIGFHAPDVKAAIEAPAGQRVNTYLACLESLPQRLETIGRLSDTSGSTPLPLISTYSSVMEHLKADYYGQPVKERELTYDAIRGTLASLGDPYTRFLDPDAYKKMRQENEGNFSGIGAELGTNKSHQVYVKEPMDNQPAKLAGVKANDVILAVDGKSIAHMDIEDVIKLIRGPKNTKVRLTLHRSGRSRPLNIVIVRRMVQFPIVTWKMLDKKDKIGYVRLFQFNEQSDSQLDKALTALDKEHMRGLVFDLRGNPGGLLSMAVDIGSRFIESGPVVIIEDRGGQKRPLYVEDEQHNHPRCPLVVLVDKGSASASEIVSGAIKDDDAGTLVGTTTFGKARVQTIVPLSDGSAAVITTAKYLTPKGFDINKKGIKPNVFVREPDNYNPDKPDTDLQLTKGLEVLKVKMGLLPKSVLDKMQRTAKAAK